MLTHRTAARLDLVLAVLRWNQLKGNIPDGPVSPEAIAELSRALDVPVSTRTIDKYISTTLAKARQHATSSLKTEH